MKRYLYQRYLSCFLLLIICVSLLVCPRVASADAIFPHYLKGEWINKGYLSDISENKSPQKTINKYEYTALLVGQKGKEFQLGLIINFHEGLNFKLKKMEQLNKGKKYRAHFFQPDEMPEYAKTIMLEIRLGDSTAKISIIEPSGAKGKPGKRIHQEFVKALPSIDGLINKIILKGKYKDQTGETIEFTDDLFAIWPQKKFKYSICTDITFEHDCFYEVDQKGMALKTYSYEFVGDMLVIKDVDTGNILFKLKKIGK